MVEQMSEYFLSWLASPTALGIGLAVVFGALWLLGYWPPLFRKPWLWAVLVGSTALTWVAISFVQLPLQTWAQQMLEGMLGEDTLERWLLLSGIWIILISGLVQEGAKLLPVAVYWWRRGGRLDARVGLAVGAIAGVGFAIFEAQWVHNMMLSTGWTWQSVTANGPGALAGFWERFFTVAFHGAATAIAGYGLARGRGVEFYLLAVLLHIIFDYSVLFLRTGLFSIIQVEIYIAVVAVLVSAAALWLRWRKEEVASSAENTLE